MYLRWMDPKMSAYMDASEARTRQDSVPLSKISKNLQNAVIIAEDDRFFDHDGIDFQAMKEALKEDIKRREFAFGASTITMQLARNLYLSPTKSVLRKIREIFIALKMEREIPKKRILELYLNYVQFGCTTYGAEAAAEHYFNKSARNLTPYEAAYLAALLPRPCYYDRNRSSEYLANRVTSIEGRL